MSEGLSDRDQAAHLPEGDVVAILLEQHARIKELFATVKGAQGEAKKEAFDELRALLAVHETAEEMILRPVAADTAGKEEADARNEEEAEANKVLAALEKMDVTDAEFDAELAKFEQAVVEHAEHEEQEEFPAVRAGCTEEQLRKMGQRLQTVEKMAPTHPHPTAAGSPKAQWMTGPFASMVDRAKDALSRG
ncbi:hemerythrin domain-containing protein [Streptomyces sp. SLBN-31]|uniref:hemerythrin domain-containing protein n=1 Tax=Streptomyces sp. SLBN-31 TaxID=2768444 RepID=UPI001152A903|nr:hemerythrin domain-containing protein [Streptomyces sp. SLBN-31]TQJ91264.1 hemerythrin HHE cation binding domain-containing protein [Streptomyces sp. SLBN-31]